MFLERDYQYYGCHIRQYFFNQDEKTLILSCDYLGRPFITLMFHNVLAYDALEFLSNHTINYITSVYDMESDAKLFEIHFNQLFEVTKIWATKMLPASDHTDSQNL